MGKTKYKQEIEALLEKSPIVNYSSVSRIIRHQKKNNGYAKRMINYLLKKKKLKRLTKSHYTIRDDASLVVLCFQPAYLGLQDALSFYNLWEQETIPVVITSKNIRPGIRNVLDSNVLLRKINKRYIFGIEYHQHGDVALPYSDIEKTFIDMVYFKENIDEEIIKNIKKRVNLHKLKSYLKHYPKKLRDNVLSYF